MAEYRMWGRRVTRAIETIKDTERAEDTQAEFNTQKPCAMYEKKDAYVIQIVEKT